MSEDAAYFTRVTFNIQTYNFYGIDIESVTRVKQAASSLILEGFH